MDFDDISIFLIMGQVITLALIVQVSSCSQMTETVRVDDTNLTNNKNRDSSTYLSHSKTNLTWHHVFVAPSKLRILSISTNGIELFELIFLIIVQVGRGGTSDDYWSEDFDTSKNCLQEKKIIELRDKVSVHNQIKVIQQHEVW